MESIFFFTAYLKERTVQPSSLISQDLGQYAAHPFSPWQLSDSLFQNVQSASPSGNFRKYEVLGTDPEAKFVVELFSRSTPAKFGIRKIWVIHNPNQTASFEANIKTIDDEAKQPFYAPNWRKEPHADERKPTHKRWKEMAKVFSPVQVMEKERMDRCNDAKIFPLWHGANADKCESICNAGFTSLGKHHFTDANAPKGEFSSTDRGYFGSGIYFSDSADYASMYSSGNLLMTWVVMREPYPVYSDLADSKHCSDMRTLGGKEHFQNYNAHFIPVKHVSGMEYYPCAQGQVPVWDEFVVFGKAQTLPRFWVELGVNLPKNPFNNLPQVIPQALVQAAPQVSAGTPSFWDELSFGGSQLLKKVEDLYRWDEFSTDRDLLENDFALLQRYANNGDREAQHLLGICHDRGIGTSQDLETAVEYYSKAAKQGLPWAQYRLGHCLDYGDGVVKDREEAEWWFLKSVETENPRLQYALAKFYGNFNGKKWTEWCLKAAENGSKDAFDQIYYRYENHRMFLDDKKSLTEWRQRCSDLGIGNASYELGECYEKGEGVEQDFKTALAYYEKAAEQNDGRAAYNLGVRYENGEGVAKDFARALKYYEKASTNGSFEAAFRLGVCYENGEGVEQDFKRAAGFYEAAAGELPLPPGAMLSGRVLPEATYRLGLCYLFGRGKDQNKKEALKLFESAGEKGIVDAQIRAGLLHKAEHNPMKANPRKALEWFQKAADQGSARACYELGICYKYGHGVAASRATTFSWFQKAADQDFAKAYYELGHCYGNGLGVKKDKKQAIALYEKAGALGDAEAQRFIGQCMSRGEDGFKKDKKLAAAWLQKAAEQGNVDAMRLLSECYQKGWGVPKDKAEAERWRAKSKNH